MPHDWVHSSGLRAETGGVIIFIAAPSSLRDFGGNSAVRLCSSHCGGGGDVVWAAFASRGTSKTRYVPEQTRPLSWTKFNSRVVR